MTLGSLSKIHLYKDFNNSPSPGRYGVFVLIFDNMVPHHVCQVLQRVNGNTTTCLLSTPIYLSEQGCTSDLVT